MSTTEKEPAAELDEYGLPIPVYTSVVLFVIPPRDFAESTLRYARSKLLGADIGSRVVSLQDEEPVHGSRQDEFQPEGVLRDAKMDEFAGVVFCGGRGALELVEDPETLRLAREAATKNKVIGAWGHSAAILARAGIVENRRVTGDSSLREALTAAGATFTASQVEVDGNLVTAGDDTAGVRFATALRRLLTR